MATKKEYDPWDFQEEKTEYNPDEYYIGSSRRGDGVQKYFKMSAGIAHEISVLVQHRNFPYRTDADFIRDAIVHRLRWCQEKEGTESPLLRAEKMEARVNARKMAQAKMDDNYRQYQALIRRAREDRNWLEIKRIASELAGEMEWMEEPNLTKFHLLVQEALAGAPLEAVDELLELGDRWQS